MTPDHGIPESILRLLDARTVSEEGAGESGALVLRARGWDGCDYILKGAPTDVAGMIEAEAARLRWLEGRGIRCPSAKGLAQGRGWSWLLMSALPGRNAVESESAPECLVRTAAATLRQLHALPAADCPFFMGIAQRLAFARIRHGHGLLDAEDLDHEVTGGRGIETIVGDLSRRAPAEDDLVVTHGDACLDNLMIDDDGACSGVIDVGRLGVALRAQDLALMERSISENLGETYVDLFRQTYGYAPLANELCAYLFLLEELG